MRETMAVRAMWMFLNPVEIVSVMLRDTLSRYQHTTQDVNLRICEYHAGLACVLNSVLGLAVFSCNATDCTSQMF